VKNSRAYVAIRTWVGVSGILALQILLGGWRQARALDAALQTNEYAHTAWTVRDGFSLGNIYAIAQSPDGYL
jgi:hypothetical protein